MNIRCLNPDCRRFLCEVSLTASATIRVPCPKCAGQSTYLFGNSGHLDGKRYERPQIKGDKLTRIPLGQKEPLAP